MAQGADESVRLLVGLGNPGDRYDGTRHNAGADFVAAVARAGGARLAEEKKFKGLTGRVVIDGVDVRLLVPTTFYNGSGDAVGPMLRFYRIPVSGLLVAQDELDLPVGVARLKQGGGHGGNNGLRDIIRALGGDAGFGRLRIGVDHPGDKSRVTGYLLAKPPGGERDAIEDASAAARDVLPLLVAGDWQRASTELHTRTKA